MEGGIAIFLLLLVIVIGAIAAAAMYLGGGAIRGSERHGSSAEDGDGGRPLHKAPRTRVEERRHFVGTPEGDEAARRRRETS